MTYLQALAKKRATLEFFVQIGGIKYVIGTSPSAPTDSWYTSAGHSYLRGARMDSINLSCSARPGEVWPDISSFDVLFDDLTGALAAHLISIESCATTELAATVNDLVTTINVGSTASFASPDVAFIDQEAIKYTGITGTSFTGCTRGWYGSQAVEHVVDANVWPPLEPEVSSGPGDLRGRRVVIYAGERVGGTLSATSQVWVGWVNGYVDFAAGMIRFPVKHILEAFIDGKLMGWSPSGRLRGILLANRGRRTSSNTPSWGFAEVFDGASFSTVSWIPTGTEVLYDSIEDILDLWIDSINSVTNFEGGRMADGRLYVTYNGTVTNAAISSEGTLHQILGFMRGGHGSFERLIPGEPFIAENQPYSFFCPIAEVTNTGEPAKLYLREGEASQFVESWCRISSGGETSGPLEVIAIDTVNDYLEVASHSTLTGVLEGDGSTTMSYIAAFAGAALPTVKQELALDGTEIHEAIRAFWSGEIYTGLSSPWRFTVDLPHRWKANPALEDGDVDWDELKTLVQSSPATAKTVVFGLTKPKEAGELFTGHLMACGIYAFVKGDGTIGWARARVPSIGESATTLDSSYIDQTRCAEIETLYGRDRLMNAVEFEVVFEDMSGDEVKRSIYVVDQRSLQRYGTQLARDVSDPVKAISKTATKIELHADRGVALGVWSASDADTGEVLARHLAGTLFGLLSKPRVMVRIPVTPQARLFEIGDIVSATTRWAFDTATGQMGVTAKLGIIMGWDRPLGNQGCDYLDVMLIDEALGVIAPSALATSWVSGTKTLTFADTDLFHGAADSTDLDHFEAGDYLRIIQWHTPTPTVWEATISSVNPGAGTMILTTAPVGLTAPCVATFGHYEDCTTDQIGEGWVWLSDDADGQVQDSRVGWRWS